MNTGERLTRHELEEHINRINESSLKDSKMRLSIIRCGSFLNIEINTENKDKVLLYQGTIRECKGFIGGLEKFYNVLSNNNSIGKSP